MWKTGYVMGYRWEAILDGNTVRKTAIHKGAQLVEKPSKFLGLCVKIAARVAR